MRQTTRHLPDTGPGEGAALAPDMAVLLICRAVLAGGVWAWPETRAEDPLIDVHVLLSAPVLRANLATVGLGWALFGSYLLVPQFATADPATAHYGLGAATAAVGLIMVPLAAGQTLAGPLAGLASRRAGPRAVFAAGLILVAAALGWLSVIRGGLLPCTGALLLLGIGAGAGLQSSSSVATQDVSEDVAATSSALNSTIRRFAGGIGGQVSTIFWPPTRSSAQAPRGWPRSPWPTWSPRPCAPPGP